MIPSEDLFLFKSNFFSMPSNVKIKARVRNLSALREAAAAISDDKDMIEQRDVFFNVNCGRLKLRQILSPVDGRIPPAQLIFYQRSDVKGPKLSEFGFYETSQPDTLEETLTAALGKKGKVRDASTIFKKFVAASTMRPSTTA